MLWSRLEAYPAGVLAVFLHLLPDEIHGNVEGVRQCQGVKVLHLTRRYLDVIGNLVPHQDGAVAVIDHAAGGVYDVVHH